jgi:hypothetical protein
VALGVLVRLSRCGADGVETELVREPLQLPVCHAGIVPALTVCWAAFDRPRTTYNAPPPNRGR